MGQAAISEEGEQDHEAYAQGVKAGFGAGEASESQKHKEGSTNIDRNTQLIKSDRAGLGPVS